MPVGAHDMPLYRPETPWEMFLTWLSRFENEIGGKARGRLKRVQGPRAVADFQTRLPGIGPGDVCLDLGANVGSFTAEMASRGCEVHSYEPDPTAWEALVKNVGHLPNVTLHNSAVAVTAGTFRLRRARSFADDPLGSTVMSSIVLTDPRRFQDDEGIDVDVRAFQDVIAGFGRRVALVKMDIEGAEFDILRLIFANPAAFDIDAIFCETHERDAYAEFREIDRMRRESDRLERPYINLYWP
ncbi:FkbM family methyltransferase [Tabrizicola sp.]|uniref:FkbM family methyltransferase n=1 Tax=Tabrizicola sp. TaxID=2005166 RepID=UPI003F322941